MLLYTYLIQFYGIDAKHAQFMLHQQHWSGDVSVLNANISSRGAIGIFLVVSHGRWKGRVETFLVTHKAVVRSLKSMVNFPKKWFSTTLEENEIKHIMEGN